MPISIFLSYARGDDEEFVRRLHDDLTKARFDVWFDRVSMPSRQLTFHQEIRDAIAARGRVVFVIGPRAAVSEYVGQEWRWALEMGKCVNPIVRLDGQQRADGTRIDGYELLPEELKLIHAEDFRDDAGYAAHLANIIRQLSEPPPPLGRLFGVPSLPTHYRAQPDRVKQLREALLVDLHKPMIASGVAGLTGGAAARLCVTGMGGIGKSVLANALARNLEIRRAFPGGIFWIRIGQQPNVVELQRQAVNTLGGDAMFDDTHTGKQRLRELLEQRATLLVLDDVWQRAHADAFDVLGPKCKLLFTTRDAGLGTALAGTSYQVQLPTMSEALALVATAAQADIYALPSGAREVVDECGRLPLALMLCGGMVQAGTSWQDLVDALREHDLAFPENPHDTEEQHVSIWRTIDVSMRALPEEQHQRFMELAVFPPVSSVPEAAVLTLWAHTGDLDERRARKLLVALEQRSLLQIDHPVGRPDSARVSLHDLIHDFATRDVIERTGGVAPLHQMLLEAWRTKCPEGWPDGPNDGWFLQHLRDHLCAAGRADELGSLLLELRWLETKNDAGLAFDLIQDFETALRVLPGAHAEHRLLSLLNEALRRDIHFIARHAENYPQALFQCLWNSCWWYDCPLAAAHYVVRDKTRRREEMTPRLYKLLETWRGQRERRTPAFHWLRALRPPLISLNAGQSAVMHGHREQVSSVAYSPDDRLILSGSYDNTIRLWHGTTGEELAECDCGQESRRSAPSGLEVDLLIILHNYTDVIESVAFSPDGRRCISGSRDATIRLWDVQTRIQLSVMRGHEEFISSVTYSPDGRAIASGSADSTVRVWDADTGGELAILRGHHSVITSVAFSPDGSYLASASTDMTVRLWKLDSMDEIFVCRGHQDAVNSVAFSPDGSRLVSGSRDETARVWNRTGAELAVCCGDSSVNSVAFSPDGSRVALGLMDHSVHVWNLGTAMGRDILQGHEGPVESVAFSHDGCHLVSGSKDKTVRLWNVHMKRYAQILREHDGLIRSVAFSSDGHRVVTGSGDKTARVWNVEDGTQRAVLRGHESGVRAAFSPDGHWIAGSGAMDNTTRVWDLESEAELAILRGEKDGTLCVAFSADGRWLASGGYGGVSIWKVAYFLRFASYSRSIAKWWERWLRPAVLSGHEQPVVSLAFSNDGRLIASGSIDGSIKVWDLRTGRELQAFPGHHDSVERVALSPDGTLLVSQSRDQTLRMWDVQTGKCLDVVDGEADVNVIAAGSDRFPYRVFAYAFETVIERSIDGLPVAWFPGRLALVTTSLGGRTWGGATANHLYLFTLEGTLASSGLR